MMFLAHFSNTGFKEVLSWPISKIQYRYELAFTMYKNLNPEKFKEE